MLLGLKKEKDSRKKGNIIMISNVDCYQKGSKEVNVTTTSGEKQRVTVELAICSDGSKLPIYLIFKGKKIPNKSNHDRISQSINLIIEEFCCDIQANDNAWMTETLFLD